MLLKHIISPLALLIVISFWGCEKETLESSKSVNSEKITELEGNASSRGKPGKVEAITIRDLGTLDGANSSANGINVVDGDVWIVGSASTTNDETHAFLWKQSTETMEDLGWLHQPYSHAYDINSSGTIVGGTGNPNNPYGNAVMWDSDGNIIDIGQQLPFESAYFHSGANAINDDGVIVGWVVPDYDNSRHIWKWPMVDLGNLGANSARANGVNVQGTIVGSISARPPNFDAKAVWAPNGDAASLDTIPGFETFFSSASDINDNGQIVGRFNPECPTCEARGFLWENGNITELPTLGNSHPNWTFANAISEDGYVTGTSPPSSGSGVSHAFLWRDDIGIVDLGTLKGGKESNGYDVIEHPVETNIILVVGNSGKKHDESHAILWTVDLSLL